MPPPAKLIAGVVTTQKSTFEATLGADLTSILGALTDIYGIEHAMEMWTHSAELYIEIMKGE